MTISSCRRRAAGVLLGLFGASTIALVLTPGVAQAACSGTTEVTSTITVTAINTTATEKAVKGTCQGNNYYQGTIASSTSGYRASVHIQNNGQWSGFFTGANGKEVPYNFTDNNSHSGIVLCLDDGTTWYCGWGTKIVIGTGFNSTFSGITEGF